MPVSEADSTSALRSSGRFFIFVVRYIQILKPLVALVLQGLSLIMSDVDSNDGRLIQPWRCVWPFVGQLI